MPSERDMPLAGGPPWRAEWPWVLPIAAGLFVLYLRTMPRTVTLEDAGEFLSVARFGGIAHPPGYPTYTMLAALCARLPFGSVALRVHLVSAAAAVAACGCVYACARLLSLPRGGAVFAALLYGVSATFWSQAIVAEVYTLNAFFFFLLLALCLRLGERFDPRTLHLTAFVSGLSLTNHWPLMALSAPALVLALSGRLPQVWRRLPAVLGCLAVGLAPYLYLVLRSRFDPEVTAFGPIDSWRALAAYVARTRYATVDVQATATAADAWAFVRALGARLPREFSPPGAVLVVAGIAAAWRTLPRRNTAALLAALLSCPVLLLVLARHDFDELRWEDYLVRQLVPFGAAALFAGTAVSAMGAAAGPRRVAAAAAAGVVLLWSGAVNFGANDLRDETLAHDYATAVLGTLPPDAVLVVNTDTDSGSIAYARLVEGLRPDVTVLSRPGYLFPPAGNLERVIAERGRIFDTDVASADLAVERFSVLDLGLLHEVAARPERRDEEALVARATRVLDAEIAGRHGRQWTFHRNVLLGRFCRVLLRHGRRHPALERVWTCRWQLAKTLGERGEHARALALLAELLDGGYTSPKHIRQLLYHDYLVVELARIERLPVPERAGAYRRLVERVRPAVDLYPRCDNIVVRNLLEIASQTPVDIDRAHLEDRFGHCAELSAAFRAPPASP